MRAYEAEFDAKHTLVKALSWRTAYLAKVKKFPSFQDYMNDGKKADKMTPEEAEEFKASWAAKKVYWEKHAADLVSRGKL